MQLHEHAHSEPPNVRPPEFISAGLRHAFIHSLLEKGKTGQVGHQAAVETIMATHGSYYFNKSTVRYERLKALNAFYPFRDDPWSLYYVLKVNEGMWHLLIRYHDGNVHLLEYYIFIIDDPNCFVRKVYQDAVIIFFDWQIQLAKLCGKTTVPLIYSYFINLSKILTQFIIIGRATIAK